VGSTGEDEDNKEDRNSASFKEGIMFLRTQILLDPVSHPSSPTLTTTTMASFHQHTTSNLSAINSGTQDAYDSTTPSIDGVRFNSFH
jgi:hypothetical protein